MAADNTLFLTPLLASCGAIAAFLGARHQHISSLIRKKTEYIFTQDDLQTEELENIMAQIILFSNRNNVIEEAVFSSLFGGIVFAADIVIFHFASDIPLGWMIVFVLFGSIALALSLYLAIKEFSQSRRTLDLEIFLAGSKQFKSNVDTNRDTILGMYGKSEEQRKKYLEYLLEQAKEVRIKRQGRLDKLLKKRK
jgi:hypothetical protein